MDPEVAQRVQSLLDAGKVSEGEAAALLRELSPLQREKAEGAMQIHDWRGIWIFDIEASQVFSEIEGLFG